MPQTDPTQSPSPSQRVKTAQRAPAKLPNPDDLLASNASPTAGSLPTGVLVQALVAKGFVAVKGTDRLFEVAAKKFHIPSLFMRLVSYASIFIVCVGIVLGSVHLFGRYVITPLSVHKYQTGYYLGEPIPGYSAGSADFSATQVPGALELVVTFHSDPGTPDNPLGFVLSDYSVSGTPPYDIEFDQNIVTISTHGGYAGSVDRVHKVQYIPPGDTKGKTYTWADILKLLFKSLS